MSHNDLEILWRIIEAIIGALVLWGFSSLRKTVSVVEKLSFLVLGVDGRNGMRSTLKVLGERVESNVHRLDQHDNTLARVFERLEAVEDEKD